MSAQARRQVLNKLTGPGGEYELADRKLPDGTLVRVVKDAPDRVLDLLLESRRFADLEYIAYRDEVYTFGDVIQQTEQLAGALRQLGVSRGDRVAVCMRNCPEWPAAFFAPMAIGAITVSLNGWWSGEELAYGLRDAQVRALIVDRHRLERIGGSLSEMGIRTIAVRSPATSSNGVVAWDEALRSARPADLSRHPCSPDDDCLMLYTTGSTAGPKAAVSTHLNVVQALLAWEIENRAQAELRGQALPDEPFQVQHRMLVTIPFFHVTACHVCMLTGLRFGRRLTLMHKWNAEEALDTIERDRITHFISVPTVTGDLVRSAADSKRSLPSLLAVGGGGAHRARGAGRRDTGHFRERPARNRVGHDRNERDRHSDLGPGLLARADQQRPLLRAHGHVDCRSGLRLTVGSRRDRGALGEGSARGQRLLEQSAGHGRGLSGRMVPDRRSRVC